MRLQGHRIVLPGANNIPLEFQMWSSEMYNILRDKPCRWVRQTYCLVLSSISSIQVSSTPNNTNDTEKISGESLKLIWSFRHNPAASRAKVRVIYSNPTEIGSRASHVQLVMALIYRESTLILLLTKVLEVAFYPPKIWWVLELPLHRECTLKMQESWIPMRICLEGLQSQDLTYQLDTPYCPQIITA